MTKILFTGYFLVPVLAFWVWMLVDCARRRFRDSNTKMLWALVILLSLPPVGALVYYWLGRPQGVRER